MLKFVFSILLQGLELRKKAEERASAGGTEGCTFAPSLSSKAKQLTRPGTAADRLYDPDWVKKRNSADRNDPSATAAAAFKFMPKINATQAPSTPRSAIVGQGILSEEETTPASTTDRVDALEAISSKAASPSGGSFQRERNGPVFDRLYNESARHKTRLDAVRAKWTEAELAGLTFKPDTAASRASAALAGIKAADLGAGAGVGSGGGRAENTTYEAAKGDDAFQRLYQEAIEQKERQNKRISTVVPLDPQFTFAPDVNPASRKIAEAAAAAHVALPGTEGQVRACGGKVPSRIEILYAEGIQKVSACVELSV